MLERIRAEGPLSALDFERERGATTDWFGVPTNTVRAVLEAYAVTGVLGLARRDGNRRYYDLLERLLPADVLAREVPLREQLRHKLLSRYRAHGLLGVGGGGDIFGGLGPAKPDPRWPEYPGRTALREELVDDGELVPVEVEGVRGKRFVLARGGRAAGSAARAAALRRIPRRRSIRWSGTAASSDPCSSFDYVWELFVPPAKRRWGWYVLPIALPRPPRRPDRAADRPRRRPACRCSTSGGRIRAAPVEGFV